MNCNIKNSTKCINDAFVSNSGSSVAIPDIVRAHGLQEMHRYPLVSYGKPAGDDAEFKSWRVPVSYAWKYPQIQIGKTGANIAALVFDCDNRIAGPAIWKLDQSHMPNWQVFRVNNGHRHIVFTLAKPVHCYPTAKNRKPYKYVVRIAEYLTQLLGADGGYNGMLTHNPVYQSDQFATHWGQHGGRSEPYDLYELGQLVPKGYKRPKIAVSAIGRNCDLFESCMRWAADKRNRDKPVLPYAMQINSMFVPKGLKYPEVKATAKSVERYRAEWEGRDWHSERFIESRRERGRRGGLKSKRGVDPNSERTLKPWAELGISRATYYNRKRNADNGVTE